MTTPSGGGGECVESLLKGSRLDWMSSFLTGGTEQSIPGTGSSLKRTQRLENGWLWEDSKKVWLQLKYRMMPGAMVGKSCEQRWGRLNATGA